MKILKRILYIIVFLCGIGLFDGYAQGHHGGNKQRNGGRHGQFNNRGFRYRSMYRPAHRVRNYRPLWAQNHYYRRRWVYFPNYNFYWDNWRQMYVYQNNALWYYNATPPANIVNINIENEKHVELAEDEDDQDSIYIKNPDHIQNYMKK